LGTLSYFKYLNFFLENIVPGFSAPDSLAGAALPVGISFFTFTQIAYLVDKYKGHITNYTIADFALFVSFFPHLVAGPVLYHRGVLPQIQSRAFGAPTARRFNFGLLFFAVGLFKKVLIADPLAGTVATVFDSGTAPGMLDAWIGALSYTFQLYFDFSGYSDMAIGLALFLNVRIPFNFDSPYKSTSIIDFWRRWHMSLSFFLRHYLYISLGGNRKGRIRRNVNLMITMILGGLWHGAGWNFVLWGGVHGTFLIANHAWRRFGIPLPAAVGWTLTFSAVVFGWVLFRAPDMNTAIAVLAAMVGIGESGSALISAHLEDLIHLMLLLLVCVLCPNSQEIIYRRRWQLAKSVAASALLASAILSLSNETDFLYRFF